jgi:hypothetical protein
MRTAILKYITGLNLKPFVVAQSLPFQENGTPLPFKNRRHIYVDVDQTQQTNSFNTLQGGSGIQEVITVRAYVVNDSKQLPPNYETMVNQVKTAGYTTDITGVIDRFCQVKTSYHEDDLLTEFDFSFRRLITN